MNQFKIENPYQEEDIVRVTIMIEEGYDKEEVIERVSQAMKNKNFELHNIKISDQLFTANVQYSLIEEIKNIEGVESVQISKKVEINIPSQEKPQTTEIQHQETQNSTPVYVVGGLVVLVVCALLIKKLRK